MTRRAVARGYVLALALLGATWGTSARAAEPASDPQALLDRLAPAIVAVDAVFAMKVSYQGQVVMEQEQHVEGLGAVIDPSGLVVVGDVGHMTKAVEQGMPGLAVSIAPRSMKVTFGDEAKEHPAVLVVRDSLLGLAFLQVLDLGERRVAALDLGAVGAKPALGLDLVGVSRLGRGYDHAPQLERLSVAQVVTQPRAMWGIRGDFQQHGLPVFDRVGGLVGLLAVQFGSEGIDVEAAARGGGGMDARPFLLPIATVLPVIEQAKKRVPEAVEKARKEPPAMAEETPPAMTEETPPQEPSTPK